MYDSSFSRVPPRALAEVLGPAALCSILRLLYDTYVKTRRGMVIRPNMTENEITEEFFVALNLLWRDTDISLVPIHEKGDATRAKRRGRPPTIDLCFRSQWGSNVYLGVECKVLVEGNASLYRGYTDEGVARYIDGRYGSKADSGIMLGYIVSGRRSIITSDLEVRVRSMAGTLSVRTGISLDELKDLFESIHERIDRNPITVTHLLLDYA